MKKSVNYYLVKINRISGWCLLFLVPILFITGYGITGDYQWTSVIATAEVHSIIHKFIIPWALGIFILHSTINVYFSFKRWFRK
jgi:hypothetical protein